MFDCEVKPNGDLATLHMDIDGVTRRVTVTRGAIETRLKLARGDAKGIGVLDQCAFVRQNLPDVVEAVRRKIAIKRCQAAVVVILWEGDL